MKKRYMAGILAGCVLAGAYLVGCSWREERQSGNPENLYSEFITVDVYDELANYQGIQGGWFAKVVKDKFNMELNIIAPNVAGGGQTLYQTRFAAGDLGDLVIVSTSNGNLADLVDAGLVMDCSPLVSTRAPISVSPTP